MDKSFLLLFAKKGGLAYAITERGALAADHENDEGHTNKGGPDEDECLRQEGQVDDQEGCDGGDVGTEHVGDVDLEPVGGGAAQGADFTQDGGEAEHAEEEAGDVRLAVAPCQGQAISEQADAERGGQQRGDVIRGNRGAAGAAGGGWRGRRTGSGRT